MIMNAWLKYFDAVRCLKYCSGWLRSSTFSCQSWCVKISKKIPFFWSRLPASKETDIVSQNPLKNSKFSVKSDIFKSAVWVLWVDINENFYRVYKPNRPLGHFEEFSFNFSQIDQIIYSFTIHSAYAISLYYFYEKFWPQPQMSTKYSFLESMYVIGHSFLMVLYVQIIIHLSLREHFQMCSSTISHEIFQIFSSISNTKWRKKKFL